MMTETALGRVVSQSDWSLVIEDAVLRLLFVFRRNPLNEFNAYLPEETIASSIGEEVSWVAPALERLKARGLVEQQVLTRNFRLSPNGVTFVFSTGARGRGLGER